MNDSTLTGQALGQVTNLGLNVRKTLVDETKKTVQTTAQQIGFEQPVDAAKNMTPQAAAAGNAQAPDHQQSADNHSPAGGPAPTSDETKRFVQELYGVNPNAPKGDTEKNPGAKIAQGIAEKNPHMKPEDVQKLASLRQQLHQQVYYQPTFNRPKQQDEPVVEKLEKEKQVEMMELQEKEKKKPQKLNLPGGNSENRMGKGVGA